MALEFLGWFFSDRVSTIELRGAKTNLRNYTDPPRPPRCIKSGNDDKALRKQLFAHFRQRGRYRRVRRVVLRPLLRALLREFAACTGDVRPHRHDATGDDVAPYVI